MFPTKVVYVPSVAELSTTQKTLHALPTPFLKTTELCDAVTRVDGAWKIQTAFGLP